MKNLIMLLYYFPQNHSSLSGKFSEVIDFNAVIENFLFFYIKKNDFCVNACTTKKNEVTYMKC